MTTPIWALLLIALAPAAIAIRGTLSRRAFFACCAVVILATTCAGKHPEDPCFVTPPLETPSRFLEVSGRIDPWLEVELLVEYHSSEEACSVTFDRFAGAGCDLMYRSSVPLRRSGEEFVAAVPLDLVASGECGWRVWAIDYVVTKDSQPHVAPIPPTPLIWFRPDGSEAPEPVRVECGPEGHLPRLAKGIQCRSTEGGQGFLAPAATALRVSFVAGR